MPDGPISATGGSNRPTRKGAAAAAAHPAPITDNNPAAFDPVRTAVNTVFRNDESLRSGLADNLKKRSATSQVFARRAQKAFFNFTVSIHDEALRRQPNFLPAGGDLAKTQLDLYKQGVDRIRQSKTSRSIRLAGDGALGQIINKGNSNDGKAVRTIDVSKLVDFINARSSAGLVARQNPILMCKAKQEAARLVDQAIAAANGSPQSSPGQNSSGPGKAGANAAERSTNGGTGQPAAAAGAAKLTADQVVQDNVGLQMKTATSPEAQLAYAIPDQSLKQGDVQSFELRKGPTDTVAYHDFNTLRIAFESVWEEIIDPRVASLGQQLYEEYVKVKHFLGTDDGNDRNFTTIDDLKDLMDEIRSFTTIGLDTIPPQFQPPDSRQTPPSTENSIVSTAVDFLQDLLNPAKAVSDLAKLIFPRRTTLTWNDFKGPLPGGWGDQIDVTVQKAPEGAPPTGSVTMAIALGDNVTSWKGIQVILLDDQGHETNFTQTAVENDRWGKIGSEDPHSNKITAEMGVPTSLLKTSVLEFQKADMRSVGLQIYHPGFYRLVNLDRIPDGAKVTFTWIQPTDS